MNNRLQKVEFMRRLLSCGLLSGLLLLSSSPYFFGTLYAAGTCGGAFRSHSRNQAQQATIRALERSLYDLDSSTNLANKVAGDTVNVGYQTLDEYYSSEAANQALIGEVYDTLTTFAEGTQIVTAVSLVVLSTIPLFVKTAASSTAYTAFGVGSSALGKFADEGAQGYVKGHPKWLRNAAAEGIYSGIKSFLWDKLGDKLFPNAFQNKEAVGKAAYTLVVGLGLPEEDLGDLADGYEQLSKNFSENSQKIPYWKAQQQEAKNKQSKAMSSPDHFGETYLGTTPLCL